MPIFTQFLRLGCRCFGGPAAHIVVFQQHFVQRLKWLDEAQFQRLLALSQFLPGPASSQVGFAIGLSRGGLRGGVAAFVGFTLPAFALMLALALISRHWQGEGEIIIHGFKLIALLAVADATLSLYRQFCPRAPQQTLALLVAAALIAWPSTWTQLIALASAALLGACYLTPNPTTAEAKPQSGPLRRWPLLLFALLLLGLPLLAQLWPQAALFSQFYQSGSLVFGGGHVVLPLLQQSAGAGLDESRFLLAYGAAQAVPGPMFSIAAFLGAEAQPGSPLLGALSATLALFLPGFLLLYALIHTWSRWGQRPRVMSAIAAVNASVVGLLGAALYQPVFVSAVHSPADLSLLLLGFVLLRHSSIPIHWVLLMLFAAGGLRAYTGV